MPQNKDHNGIPQLDGSYDPDPIDKRPRTFEQMGAATDKRLQAAKDDQATQHTPTPKTTTRSQPQSAHPGLTDKRIAMNRAVLKDYTDQELLDSARDQRKRNRCRKDCTPRQRDIDEKAAMMIVDLFDREIKLRNEERADEGK